MAEHVGQRGTLRARKGAELRGARGVVVALDGVEVRLEREPRGRLDAGTILRDVEEASEVNPERRVGERRRTERGECSEERRVVGDFGEDGQRGLGHGERG